MSIYGCYNRAPLKDTLWVKDGSAVLYNGPLANGMRATVYREVEIPDRMSRECQYTRSQKTNSDPHCDGCAHKSANPDKPY